MTETFFRAAKGRISTGNPLGAFGHSSYVQSGEGDNPPGDPDLPPPQAVRAGRLYKIDAMRLVVSAKWDQFSAECRPPVPARNATFICSGSPGSGCEQFQ